jgi:hypothetical protein
MGMCKRNSAMSRFRGDTVGKQSESVNEMRDALFANEKRCDNGDFEAAAKSIKGTTGICNCKNIFSQNQ